MKHLPLVLVMLSTLGLVACGKADENPYELQPQTQKNSEAFVAKPKGLKCDLVGEAEKREVFVKLDEKDGTTTANIHDVMPESQVSLLWSVFSDYTLMSFKLAKEEGTNALSGEGFLTHKDKMSLSSEGEVASITGRLTLNEDKTGSLERRLTLLIGGSFKTMDFEEIGKLENCVGFTAPLI